MYTFSGTIIYGDSIGRGLGFPTANLDNPKEDINLKEGVYAVKATVLRKKWEGALAVMKSPWKIEVHLLDFPSRDIYGKTMKVEVVKQVSKMTKFTNQNDLMDKIADDVRKVRMVFHDVEK
jgi:riboflavin kinase / FMN adenylyltransferase